MKNLFKFTFAWWRSGHLARLITLRTQVRILPNATKSCKDSSSALKQDEGPFKGHRCLTEFRQKTGSHDRNYILAMADEKFTREAQIISGLFSFNHFSL
jgi:hypothetical protein